MLKEYAHHRHVCAQNTPPPPPTHSHFKGIDDRSANLVFMCRSTISKCLWICTDLMYYK